MNCFQKINFAWENFEFRYFWMIPSKFYNEFMVQEDLHSLSAANELSK